MSRYSMYRSAEDEKKSKNNIHPIWRGIGCILLVVIPVISYFTADYLVNNAKSISWMIIPQELFFSNLSDPNILVKVLYTAIFVFILYLILTIITFFANRFLGKSRYGPHDVPLDQVEINKSRRKY
jgi:ABC-type branched-subunit amino acid transport system permease subunit